MLLEHAIKMQFICHASRQMLFSTKWVDYVEEPMKYQALRPQFFSVGGLWLGWVGVGWVGMGRGGVVVGWVGMGRGGGEVGGGGVGGDGVGWVVVGCRVVEGWWVV